MRKQGQTFRRVLRSLIAISEGENVIFVSHARSHLDVAADLAHYILANMDTVTHSQKFKIQFENAGSLRFVTYGTFKNQEQFIFRGRKHRIIYDF